MAEGDKGSFEKVGAGLGGLAGKAGDTAVSLVGSMISSVAGTVGGWWSDRRPDEALSGFGEPEDSTCRTHFENLRRSSTPSSYDSVRPLYQFGHLAGGNPDYQGRSFDEVETDLKNAWTGDTAQQFGDWNAVRDYVSTGYSTRVKGG